MQRLKKRVSLLLALAVMAIVLAAPAVASAFNMPGLQVNNLAPNGYIGSFTNQLTYGINAPSSAVKVGIKSLSRTINAANPAINAVADFAASAETIVSPYVPGTVGSTPYTIPVANQPTNGQETFFLVTFQKGDGTLAAADSFYIARTIYTTDTLLITPQNFNPVGAVGAQGYRWIRTPANDLTRDYQFSASAQLGAQVAFSVDNGFSVGQIPWTQDHAPWSENAGTGTLTLADDTLGAEILLLRVTNPTKDDLSEGLCDGLHTVQVHGIDGAGVPSAADAETFGIDNIAPLVRAKAIEAYPNDKFTLELEFTDEGGSGVDFASLQTGDVVMTDGAGAIVAPDVAPAAAITQVPGKPYTFAFKATYTVAPTQTSGAWTWTVQASSFTDVAGNSNSKASRNIPVDLIAPTTLYAADPATAVGLPSAAGSLLWTNKPVSITFSVIDGPTPGASGVDFTEYLINPTTEPVLGTSGTKATGPVVVDTTATTGVNNVWYRSVDKAGNREVWHRVIVLFDGVKPVITSDYPVGAYMLSDFTVRLNATDANSGLAVPGIQWKVPNWNTNPTPGAPAYGWADWSNSAFPSYAVLNFIVMDATHSDDGAYTLSYRASDLAGNKAEGESIVKVDTRAPVSDGASGWIKGGSPYVISGVDQVGGAGTAATFYRVDGATKWSVSAPLNPANPRVQAATTLLTDVAIEGANKSKHTVDFFSVDNAMGDATIAFGGNSEDNTIIGFDNDGNPLFNGTYKTRTVQIDSVAPSTTAIGADSDWHDGAVTVNFTATDDESGVDFTEWSIDGTSWAKGNSATLSKAGEYTLQYRSTDKVGNVEAAKSVTVKIRQAVAPKCYAFTDKGKFKNAFIRFKVVADSTTDVTVTLKSRDGVKTLKVYNFNSRESGKLYKFRTGIAPGKYRVVVTATDINGTRQGRTGYGWLTVTR